MTESERKGAFKDSLYYREGRGGKEKVNKERKKRFL
jgi:hypothetical protein